MYIYVYICTMNKLRSVLILLLLANTICTAQKDTSHKDTAMEVKYQLILTTDEYNTLVGVIRTSGKYTAMEVEQYLDLINSKIYRIRIPKK